MRLIPNMHVIRSRIEVFVGKNHSTGHVNTADGPIAVVRNLRKVFPQTDKAKKRTVIIDRMYTSVALALRLQRMGYYVIGTVVPRRLGFPNALKVQAKKRPKSVPRGAYAIAVNKMVWK